MASAEISTSVSQPMRAMNEAERAMAEAAWQEVTSHAAEHMNIANATVDHTWTFPNVELARQQARHLAFAQWLHYTKRIAA